MPEETVTTFRELSILNTVKNALDIFPDDDSFDGALVMNINSAFMVLHQLGVGPEEPFEIEDATAKWSDFVGTNPKLNGVRTYISQWVKLNFDPPKNSFGIENLRKIVSEMEWRLKVNSTINQEGS